jgi:uncharacterized protein
MSHRRPTIHFRQVSAGKTAIALLLAMACSASPIHAAEPAKKSAPTTALPASKDGYETLVWEQLIPKGWEPAQALKSLDLSTLKDGDPRATEALASMRSAWDAAPAEPTLNGKKVRMPGFVLPLDQVGESVKTMLLVPYFGACIHSPPPPANQMVQVSFTKPQAGLRTMDAVWVSGVIEVFRADSPWGAAGYRINAVKVEPYK